MRDNLHCSCHICRVESYLFTALSELPWSARFSKLAAKSPHFAEFANVSDLLGHLHVRGNADSSGRLICGLLDALLCEEAAAPDSELIQSVLVLAFTPTIHRTYREVRAWFRELEPEDIAQQTFAFFLQLTASAPAGMLNHHIAFVLSQALHRNAVRWARREQAKRLERDRFLEEHGAVAEPSEAAQFEVICLLKEFLDYSIRKAIISEFERDLLLKMKVDGFIAKEVLERHTALSPKAVHVRGQRILKRLQSAAREVPSLGGNSGKTVESVETTQTKIPSENASTFSSSTFSGGAAISKSRRPLSPDFSPSQSTTKAQQFSTTHRNWLAFATPPKATGRTDVISGAAPQPLAANRASVSPHTTSRPTQSGESLPSNPDASPPAAAGRSRILRKELAGNEENPPKQICLALARRSGLAPARTRHVLLLADSRIGGVCSSGRRFSVGERGQRVDAGVRHDHRARTIARFHCGCRSDLRFW